MRGCVAMEEGLSFPGAGVTCGCEPPAVVLGTKFRSSARTESALKSSPQPLPHDVS